MRVPSRWALPTRTNRLNGRATRCGGCIEQCFCGGPDLSVLRAAGDRRDQARRARCFMDSDPASVSPQPHQRLSDRRWGWLGGIRYRHWQRSNARDLGKSRARPLAWPQTDAPDRNALSSGPYWFGRVALRTLRPAAANESDIVSRMPEHLLESRCVGCRTLSRFLSAPRA